MAGRRRKKAPLDLGQIFDQWDGFRIGADGLLYNPMWRRGFTPGELKAQFYRLQTLSRLELLTKQLERDLARAQAAQEAAEARAFFYRSQLSLESRMGLMLQAVTTQEAQS